MKRIAVQIGLQAAYNSNLRAVQRNAKLDKRSELMNPLFVGWQQNVLMLLGQFLLPAFCAV